jgi:hypothetical protein
VGVVSNRLFLSIAEYNRHLLKAADGGIMISIETIITAGIINRDNLEKNFFMS